jgi:CheY-like chemotaxis protein
MPALDDAEDNPPLERATLTDPIRAFREADTQPPGAPPLGAPVEYLEEIRPPAPTSSPQGFTAAEKGSLDRTHDELVRFRQAVEANTLAVKNLSSKVDRVCMEVGALKTFSSTLALDAAMKSAKQNGLTGKRVLVVEDDADLLEVLDRLLCAVGCNVTGASTRAAAEALLAANRKRPFHVAIVDIRIPLAEGEPPRSAEGAELIRWLTAAYPGVARIGTSGDFGAPGLMSLSFFPLEKPFTLDRLEHALHSALGIPDASDTIPPAGFAPEVATQPSTGRETPDAKRE